jgi:hypothetical protein
MNNHCCTYLLPIRRTAFSENEGAEFAQYFDLLRHAGCYVLVIDGSLSEVFALNHQLWSHHARHEGVDRGFGYLNDKVNGIHTGVELSPNEKIVLADDDIRYTADDIDKICALLDDFEVVRPQNYFRWNVLSERVAIGPASPANHNIALGERDPPSWWARMEAARMLINRATLRTADYPGTCAFRRETMLRVGHYDGDVLFDNEEIIRHFARHGARICYANDFFVQKRAPHFRKWIEQRPRQAYEDFDLRAKTALFFSLPLLGLLAAMIGGMKGFILFLASIGLGAMLIFFIGRMRGEAKKYFPASIILFAPLWILERSLSTYWALYWFVRHGGYPFGDRLLSKGVGRDWFEGGRTAAKKLSS